MRDADHLAACGFVFCFSIGFVLVSIDSPKRSLPRYLPAERTWAWGTDAEARRSRGAQVAMDWYARSGAGLGAGAVGGLLAWVLTTLLRRGKGPLGGTTRAAAWGLAALGLGLCVLFFGLVAAKGILRS